MPEHHTQERGAITLNPSRPVPEEWLASLAEPPTSVDASTLTAGRKYILLVAGDAVVNKVIVDVGPPVSVPNPIFARYEVLPESQVPAGRIPVRSFPAPEWMAAAWRALLARYAAQDFKDAGWELVAIRATSAAAIDAALAAVAAAQPQALVVHYFDHGDSIKAGGLLSRGRVLPYLAIRTEGWETLQLPSPGGGMGRYPLFVPQPNNVSRYYTRDLARKLQADFPGVPLLLILDGCEQAPSLDYATSRLPIVVSIDRALCGTNLGLFSLLFAGPVIPADFDQPRASLPGALGPVNAVLGTYPVSYVDVSHWSWLISLVFGVEKDLKQLASMTRWLWPS